MLRPFFSRLCSTFRRRALASEFDEEAADQIALLTARYISQGMTLEEGRYAAQRQFGGLTQMKEELRDRRGFLFWKPSFRMSAISPANSESRPSSHFPPC